MPQIVPKLNLNKHPSEVVDGSIINANNMIVSYDNAIMQTEPELQTSAVTDALNIVIGETNTYEIKSIIPCNKELILFVAVEENDDIIMLYRYNEDLKTAKFCCSTDYHNGTIIGTFTYNNNNLIISFSEYFEDDSQKIPLKVINLGSYDSINSQDNNQLTNYKLHSICPEVVIPSIIITYVDGSAPKGWYYVFVRYKISEDTYTQWFDTNAHALIDSFNGTSFFDYYISKDAPGASSEIDGIRHSYSETYISDDTDVSKISFKCTGFSLDYNYNYYQLAFICVNKSSTKAYRSNDINISDTSFIFNNSNVVEDSVINIINTYNNYYNVKTLTTVNNRLYIANYKESNFENNLIDKLKSINIKITKNESYTGINIIDEPQQIVAQFIHSNNALKRVCNKWNNDFYYYNLVGAIVQDNNFDSEQFRYPFVTLQFDNIQINSTVTIKYGSTTEQILPENIIIAPFYQFQDSNNRTRYGKVFINRNGTLDDITPNGCPDTLVYVNHDNGDGNKDYIIIVQDNSKSADNVVLLVKADSFAISDSSSVINKLNNVGIYPNQYYNFFIHFVDKYGQISKGFNLSNFNVTADGVQLVENNIGNKLTYVPNPNITATGNNYKITLSFTITNIPEEITTLFVSFEKLEKTNKLNGVVNVNDKGEICFYTNELNFSDSIDFSFNKLRVYDTVRQLANGYKYKGLNNLSVKLYKVLGNSYTDYTITNKELRVADSFNNMLSSTCIVLTLEEDKMISIEQISSLFSDDYVSLYNNETKILIPCSNIKQTGFIDVNTQTGFISMHHATVYKDVFYNDTVKVFQKQNLTDAQSEVFTNYIWYDYTDVPFETLKFNNSPVVTFFPIKGLNTTDENDKTFIIGNIVECKNTVDLYQQNNIAVDTNYPKSLDWYNPNNTHEDNYSKTIRRSNILQDESHTNTWRQFSLEQYKIITENKGDIIKMISIGYYFIVHTQYSMFLFNATNSLKSNDKNNLQLSSIDIWDIDYKEIVTSQLGYAGIQKEYSGIIGNFGYIFYDSDARRIYRYDNNMVGYIDNDINNFINKLIGYNAHFVDDKHNNRILICFTKSSANDIVLSYNYRTNTFVSLHDYKYARGYNTKENIYLISKFNTENHSIVYNFSDTMFSDNASIEIMLNSNYYTMKYIDSIIYKVQAVIAGNAYNYFPVEETFDLYAADYLQVYNVHCDTGELDIRFNDAANEVNTVMDYARPYWKFGNWHFNELRNRLADYLKGTYNASECSRIFGHWFVVKFTFNQIKQIEIESVDGKFLNAEAI